MNEITVTIEIPEETTISTREYEQSHGHPQDVHGSWAFAPADTPDLDADDPAIIWLNGKLSDIVWDLPEGDWVMLP